MMSIILLAASLAVGHDDKTPDPPRIVRITLELKIESSGKVTATIVQPNLSVVPSLPPIARVAPRAAPVLSGPVPAGYHRHRDSAGNVWQHHDSNFGKVGPHLSPWTGELVWPKYYGSSSVRAYAPAANVLPTIRYQSRSTNGLFRSTFSESFNCPGGNCPVR